jgi:hypothetical protein
MPWRSILEKHPKHVGLIGMIAIEAGNLDMELANLFATAFFLSPPVGRAIFLSPHSAHARISMFRNAAKAAFSKKKTARRSKALRRINALLERSSTAMNKRHRIVHDSWGVGDQNDVGRLVIDGNPDAESLAVPEQELKTQLSDLRKLLDDIGELTREFRRAPPLLADMRKSSTKSG